MTFASALAAESPAAKPCKLARILAAMSDADAKALTAALDDQPAIVLERALRRFGTPASDSTIRKHRDGTCSCVVR